MTTLEAPHGIEMVALDIDGTLVPGGNAPSPRVVEGIRALIDEGVRVVLATGRELHNTTEVCRSLRLGEVWAVCSNGAVVARIDDASWEVTDHVTFDPRPALAALRAVAPDLRFAVEEVGVGYLTSAPFDASEIAGPRRALEGPIPETATLVITRSDRHLSGRMMPAIAGLDVWGMPYDKGTSGLVDLSPASVSKLTGVRGLAEGWGVAAGAVAAVGDYLNDIPMLEWAGWGVAMGHAPAEVLDSADAVAPSISEDGLAAVLDALLAATRAPAGGHSSQGACRGRS